MHLSWEIVKNTAQNIHQNLIPDHYLLNRIINEILLPRCRHIEILKTQHSNDVPKFYMLGDVHQNVIKSVLPKYLRQRFPNCWSGSVRIFQGIRRALGK